MQINAAFNFAKFTRNAGECLQRVAKDVDELWYGTVLQG